MSCVAVRHNRVTGFTTEWRFPHLLHLGQSRGCRTPKRLHRASVINSLHFSLVSLISTALGKKALEASYRPKITYIICGKRHHFRFFPESAGDKNGNAPAGTIIDTVSNSDRNASSSGRSLRLKFVVVVAQDIVHPTDFDFYIQSHNVGSLSFYLLQVPEGVVRLKLIGKGLLGTSRPSHYSILVDDSRFSPDTIQALTYALCYLYPRSTRSVSIGEF
jgi:eukaryotic translation initiation factor 2C